MTGAAVGSIVTGAMVGLAVVGKRGVTVGSRVTGAMDGDAVIGATVGDEVTGAIDCAGVCLVGKGVALVGLGVSLVGLGVSLVGTEVCLDGLAVGSGANRLSLSQQLKKMEFSPSVGQQLPASAAHRS